MNKVKKKAGRRETKSVAKGRKKRKSLSQHQNLSRQVVDIDSIQPVACNVSVTLTPFVSRQAVAYLCRLTEESSEGTGDSNEEREREAMKGERNRLALHNF